MKIGDAVVVRSGALDVHPNLKRDILKVEGLWPGHATVRSLSTDWSGEVSVEDLEPVVISGKPGSRPARRISEETS